MYCIIAPRTAISSSFYVKLQAAFFLLVCRARACILSRTTPINWPSPPEWHNFLNYVHVYNAYLRKWHKHIYIYIYINIHRTRGKPIIGMALWAIIIKIIPIIGLLCFRHEKVSQWLLNAGHHKANIGIRFFLYTCTCILFRNSTCTKTRKYK